MQNKSTPDVRTPWDGRISIEGGAISIERVGSGMCSRIPDPVIMEGAATIREEWLQATSLPRSPGPEYEMPFSDSTHSLEITPPSTDIRPSLRGSNIRGGFDAKFLDTDSCENVFFKSHPLQTGLEGKAGRQSDRNRFPMKCPIFPATKIYDALKF